MRIRSRTALAVIGMVLTLGLGGTGRAQTVNAVPSCYEANHVTRYTAPYDKLVYVLIDQTVLLDKQLQRSVLTNLLHLLGPGTKFVVADFSAFSQGRYFNVVKAGVIETPVPRDHVGDVVMTRLASFRTCLENQQTFARRLALGATYAAMSSQSGALHHSDILMALKTVAPAIAEDPAKKKLLFFVTDGLENSSMTTFYKHGVIRRIRVDAELAKVGHAGLMAQFGGARVYVVGGADLPPAKHGARDRREGYRDPAVLLSLQQFWSRYFTESHAELIEFGEPALVTPVHF